MWAMSENSPEPALNGHGGPAAGSVSWSDAGATATQGQSVAAARAEAEPARPPAMVDDLCRLAVCGPARSVELAVPVHVPLIDLLPALVGHLGDGLADVGLEHGGWVLQRLGDPPLREELSVAALGLRDGDVVHLRPRADQLPPLDFDDLIDGIAVGISGRPDRWRPDMSRQLLVGLLAAPLAAGLALLAGHAGTLSDILAAALALILIGLTAAASRALADLPAAGVLGAAAICYAGLAAAELPLLPGGPGAGPVVSLVTLRAALLAAGVAMAGAAAAVTMVRGGRHPALVAASLAAMLVAVGGAFATFAKLDAAEVAGILLALIVPFGGWVPVLAFRLAKMRLDPTPSTPEELQADLDPVPGQRVLESTRQADRYMTALHAGLAVVVTGSLVILGVATGWPAHLVAIDAIVLTLLHARVLVAARHRLAAVIPAVVGAAVLVTAAGLRADARTWPAVLAWLVLAAGLLLAGERSLPGHKLLPHWGRAGDLLQTFTAVALIPLVLWLLNLYEFARTARG
jgi:type VII secretion integral membrane protein EccD